MTEKAIETEYKIISNKHDRKDNLTFRGVKKSGITLWMA